MFASLEDAYRAQLKEVVAEVLKELIPAAIRERPRN
jgi:hypothetical protein